MSSNCCDVHATYTEQCRQLWDESLTRAFNLLAAIEKFEPGVVNRK